MTTDKHLVWDYFVVFLFVITSGAVFWHGMSPAVAFSVFFIVSLINVAFIKRNLLRLRNNSISFIYIVVVLSIINFIVYDVEYKDNSAFGYIVALMGSYLVVSRYDFYYFRKLFTNVVYVITIVGIIVFLLSEIEILPVYTLVTKSGTDYTMFLVYTLGWPDFFHRYSGIWHEPGACQIVLNTILWLHIDNICKWKWESGTLKKCIVILIGSLLTLSTGSYMALMLLVVSIFFNVKISGKYRFLIIVLLVTIIPLILYVFFNSPVIQDKLFDTEGEHVSKINRFADISALWRMTTERPLLGYGLGSVDFWKMSDLYGNTACSTGVLTYSASLGFTWLAAFVFFLWRALKRIEVGNVVFFFFVAIILMQFNEKFIEYPITNMLLFQFFSYNQNLLIKQIAR